MYKKAKATPPPLNNMIYDANGLLFCKFLHGTSQSLLLETLGPILAYLSVGTGWLTSQSLLLADFAGINALSAIVCGNAASCLAGMVRWPPVWPKVEKAAVAMTQFGVIDEPQVRDNDSVAQYFKNAIAKLLAYGGEDSRVHLELVLEEFLNHASEKRCLKVLELAAVLGHGLNTESRVVSTDKAETD